MSAPEKTSSPLEPAAAPASPLVLPGYWAEACKHLMKRDRVMKRLIPLCGETAPHRRGDAFTTLARSIVSQQVSVKSAERIWGRVATLEAGTTPAELLRQPAERLRAAGLSARKVEYVQDLARHFVEGGLDRCDWAAMDDEAIVETLTQVRGIGRWTAEMFLIFYLQRPNVLPLDDLGLINGISRNYFSGEAVSRSEAREVAEAWMPWCTVATWYIWRSLALQPRAD